MKILTLFNRHSNIPSPNWVCKMDEKKPRKQRVKKQKVVTK